MHVHPVHPVHPLAIFAHEWNGPSETKPNPENCKNSSSNCAQLQYTIQVHRTVLIISLLTSRQTS